MNVNNTPAPSAPASSALPMTVGELMPSNTTHASSASASANPRGNYAISVLALGSERSDGRPPEAPTSGQQAREQASRHGSSADEGAPSAPVSSAANNNRQAREGDSTDWTPSLKHVAGGFFGVLSVIAIVIFGSNANRSTPSPTPWPTPSPNPWPIPLPTPRRELCNDRDGWICPHYSWYCDAAHYSKAKENCCICGGGTTLEPVACEDTPNWTDMANDGCDWYNTYSSCTDSNIYSGTMGGANNNCCVCGGGTRKTPPPTSNATQKPSTHRPAGAPATLEPGACKDTPNWTDRYEERCDWYKVGDRCKYYSPRFSGTMGEANDNCCVCGGGSSTNPPTSNATPKPSTSMPAGAPSKSPSSEEKSDKPAPSPVHYHPLIPPSNSNSSEVAPSFLRTNNGIDSENQ